MESDRERALELLRATHQFPVEYHLSVITVHEETVFQHLRLAVEEGLPQPIADSAYERVASSGGKYASHRFRVPCATAEEVLDLYARVRTVTGVMNVL